MPRGSHGRVLPTEDALTGRNKEALPRIELPPDVDEARRLDPEQRLPEETALIHKLHDLVHTRSVSVRGCSFLNRPYCGEHALCWSECADDPPGGNRRAKLGESQTPANRVQGGALA